MQCNDLLFLIIPLFCFKNAACLKLMKSLNQRNHRWDSSSLEVKINDPVAVQVENVWYRGVCSEQTSSDEIKISLMDFGRSVSVSKKMIRTLNPKFSKVPSFCHRVRVIVSIYVINFILN